MVPWSQIITGVVGLAGIGGTLWQGMRASAAENKRDWLIEKRRIYAQFQTAAETYSRASIRNAKVPDGRDDKPAAEEAVETANRDMYFAFHEIWLVAPAGVENAAMILLLHLQDHEADSQEWASKYNILQERVVLEMRKDLGINTDGLTVHSGNA